MTSKSIRGFREVPKQDGSGRVTLERIPYFGLDASNKQGQKNRNNSKTRTRKKPISPQMAGLFTPVKK